MGILGCVDGVGEGVAAVDEFGLEVEFNASKLDGTMKKRIVVWIG